MARPQLSTGVERQRCTPWSAAKDSRKRLRLCDFGAQGTVPAVFGDMTELEWLQAFENKLAGTFPDGLGCISKLRTLDLGRNALTGKIPATVGSVQLALLALQDLYLNDNELKGTLPAGLASFRLLTGLNLNENHFSGVLPPVLAMLRKLKFLFCGRNLFAGAVLRRAKSRDSYIAESLARVIAAIRIAGVRWRSYLPPEHRN